MANRSRINRSTRTESRASLLVVAALLLVALSVGAGAFVVLGGLPAAANPSATPKLDTSPSYATLDPLAPLSVESISRVPHLVFQNVVRDQDYAEAALVPLGSPAGMRLATGLVCERIHFAAEQGICLSAEHDPETRYLAVLFDASFQSTHELELGGAPTFARVSPDGRVAAASFQTSPPTAQAPFAPSETWLLDAATGSVLADLADFRLVREGVEVADEEVDYWGVTFKRDGDGFYASVRFGGNIYLVEGSIADERLVVLDSGISAPSLSPDETKIAYARLVSNVGPTWRFHVRDLVTGDDIELAEATSIDDQMEWMNSEDLLYGRAADIWQVQANGGGAAQPFLFGGLSPAVVVPSD